MVYQPMKYPLFHLTNVYKKHPYIHVSKLTTHILEWSDGTTDKISNLAEVISNNTKVDLRTKCNPETQFFSCENSSKDLKSS